MKSEYRGMLQMLICSVLWSIAGILIKLIPWNPLIIAGGRSLLAALTVLIYVAITRQKIIFNRNVFKSMLFLAATFLCFVGASKFTTSANAIVLQFSAPVFILLFSVLFQRQKAVPLDIAAVALTLLGITLFAVDGIESGHTLGNLLGLGAGLSMAGMFLSVSHCQGAEKMSGILFGHLLTAAIGLPFAFLFPPPMSGKAIAAITVLGVLQLGIPYILMALATSHCPPLACSLLSAAEPLLNPVWVALFAGEYPSPLSLCGGVIVILSVTAWCALKERVPRRV